MNVNLPRKNVCWEDDSIRRMFMKDRFVTAAGPDFGDINLNLSRPRHSVLGSLEEIGFMARSLAMNLLIGKNDLFEHWSMYAGRKYILLHRG